MLQIERTPRSISEVCEACEVLTPSFIRRRSVSREEEEGFPV